MLAFSLCVLVLGCSDENGGFGQPRSPSAPSPRGCEGSVPLEGLELVLSEPFFAPSSPDPEGYNLLLVSTGGGPAEPEGYVGALESLGWSIDELPISLDWVEFGAERAEPSYAYLEVGSVDDFVESPSTPPRVADRFRGAGGSLVVTCLQ